MKKIILILLAFATSFTYAQNHDHHSHDGNTDKQTSLSAEKKFAPTDDLKVRMEKILILAKELDGKKKDSKAVVEYGDKIAAVVNDIFKTCKLEPEADAAIHPALGKIMQGSKQLKKGSYSKGHQKIEEGLSQYEKLFTHEGWNQ